MLNRKLQQVVTRETSFHRPQEIWMNVNMEEVFVTKGNLDEGKAAGSDGVSGYMLKNC